MSYLGGDEIIIRSMLIQQTGTFCDVYNRTYEMNLDDRALESVRGRLRNTGGSDARITDRAFKGISSGLLMPVAQIDERRDAIAIPDGWDRPRCRFIMEVDVLSRFGGQDTYFLQGFSDHLGMTPSGNIDPKMNWFINGYVRVQYVERQTQRGTQRYGVVKASAQIINGRLVHDRDLQTDKMRTVDLFGNIQSRMLEYGASERVDDVRTRLANPRESIFVARKDNLPGVYLADSLNTYRRQIDTNAFGLDSGDILARTQQELNANIAQLESNPFLEALAGIQGRVSTTEFTLNDLLELDPEISRNGVISGSFLEGRAADQLASHRSDVSDWRGADRESVWALQIANGISALMMSNYHRALDVRISNLNIDHKAVCELFEADPVAEGMPREMTERLLDQCEDFMFDLTNGDRHDYSVTIRSNLYDQTELQISIDGEPTQRFQIPSFADGLMSPFYTRDRDALSSLSSDFERLISDVGGEMSGSAQSVARLG